MESSPLVELQRITKRFKGVRALHEVTFALPPGVTGLLGPNGAGKSTLIKILLGLVRPTSGQGKVFGRPLGSSRPAIVQRIGYMPEDDCYIPGLSGVEVVRFAARLSRIPAMEGLRRAHEVLDYCGAGQERYRTVESYSTGMRQKLKFAAALVHDPELLILDEPTSGLDPDERVAMLRRVGQLAHDFGKTVILCTHILPDVEAVGNHVVILAAGTVRTSESMRILRRPSKPQIQVRLVGEADRFAALAHAEGIEVTRAADGDLILNGEVEPLTRRVWNLGATHGFSFARVAPSQTSLQEVFLDAIRDHHHAVA